MPVTLRQGSRGPAVVDLQGNLRSAGFEVKPDGRFGPDTESAVRGFQRGRGLKEDGIVGRASWSALHRSRPVPPSLDPFDPDDYARWLAESADRAVRSIGGLFGAGRTGAPAGPAAAHAERATVRTGSHIPHEASSLGAAKGAGTREAPRPPEVSPTQNRQHDRVAFAGYDGRGYVLRGYDKYDGWEVQLAGHRIVRAFQGGIRNECAQFVQLFGVPRTTFWRAGPQVCHMAPGTIPIGAVVATLRDGVYHNDYSGRSHVGIYLGHDAYDPAKGNANAGGVRLFDQWNGSPISRRLKPYSRKANQPGKVARRAWTDTAGLRHTRRVGWASDGEEYFVLMVR